jgi:hypothetical protein
MSSETVEVQVFWNGTNKSKQHSQKMYGQICLSLFFSSYLLSKNIKTMTYKTTILHKLSNLVTHNDGTKQTNGVREQVAEENIWT